MKRNDALKIALTLGLLATSEQAMADITLNVDTLGSGTVPVTVSDDATILDIKKAYTIIYYNMILTLQPTITLTTIQNTNMYTTIMTLV